ncbi:MAG: HAD hydrolase family protein [Rhodothermales bacterium]
MTEHPSPRVRLFVSDIDGCLGEPYQAFDLGSMSRLADLARLGGRLDSSPHYPALGLCSGRPFPYVEALTQTLGLVVPVLFESGGGIFDPVSARVQWHPAFSDDLREEVEALGRWMVEHCIPGSSLLFDFAKRTQPGMISPFSEEIDRWMPVVEERVAVHHPRLTVHRTNLSIDVLPEGISKHIGMAWLSEQLDVPLAGMAYIGDSSGDLEALKAVGTSFAPQNAIEAVKSAVHRVTAPRIAGVVEAYEVCLAKNRALSR